VTCDNEEARAIVERYDDPRLSFMLRDEQSTIRTASVAPTLEKIARSLDPSLNGIIVLRYIQSPFVTAETMEEAASSLLMSEADSANGVEELGGQVFRRTPHGLEILNRRGAFRSDFDIIYRDAQTCIATRMSNLPSGSLTGKSVVSFIVSAAECFFIDSQHKLEIARLMTAGGA